MKKFLPFSSLFRRINSDDILAALSQVMDPELNRDLVSLDMVKDIELHPGRVSLTIRMREAGSPLQVPIERRARQAVLNLPGVRDVAIQFEGRPASQLRETTRLNLDAQYIIAVASGKGGVGKSTVAVNLAIALAQQGQRVGLLDADIHGPNLPQMLGITEERPIAFGEKIFPPTVHGLTVMSMGLLVPEEAAVIWRGPMLHQALRQMLRDVMWGKLDFLIIDLPPGTGDIQLTMIQSLPVTGAVLVTTPQDVALADVYRGGEMFRQLDVPVLGVVENMSFYVCAHCGEKEPVMGAGGGHRLSQQLGAPLLAQVPLDPAICAGGDAGKPAILTLPDTPAARAFIEAAQLLLEKAKNFQPASLSRPQYVPDPELSFL